MVSTTILTEIFGNSTLLAALVSAAISLFVAFFFGARASTSLSLREATRVRHNDILIEAPLTKLLKDTLANYENSVSITAAASAEIDVPKVNDVTTRADKYEDEFDLFLSHLKTGYPEIFSKLKTFLGLYNDIRQRTLDIGNRALATFTSIPNLPPRSTPKADMIEFSNPALAIQVFSHESFKAWRDNSQIAEIRISHGNFSGRILYTINCDGGMIVKTSSTQVANAIAHKMNELRDSPFHAEMLEVYGKLLELEKQHMELHKELSKIKVYVKSGVPLKGHCEAGRQAKPKIE